MNEKIILEEARYQLNFVTEEKESVEIEGFLLESLIEFIEKKNKKIEKLQKELDKKDKVIDLMAEVIEECRQNCCIEFNEEIDLSDIAGEEMVKEYFYKKVEEEK